MVPCLLKLAARWPNWETDVSQMLCHFTLPIYPTILPSIFPSRIFAHLALLCPPLIELYQAADVCFAAEAPATANCSIFGAMPCFFISSSQMR
jgi:hypothetical protein